MSTMCVISNWQRPENLDDIIDVLLAQSVPFDKIVVVDNAPKHPYRYYQGYKDSPEILDVWKFPDNGIGPPCRFMPAILDHRFDWALFLDDDFLPGLQMHEHLLEQAALLDKKFATLGQVGRILGDKHKYEVWDTPRHPTLPRPVDITCRAHFVDRADVIDALQLRDDIMRNTMPIAEGNLRHNWQRHDDILLCLGIQRTTGYPSYIIPACDPEKAIIKQKLEDKEHAMHTRPGHIESRQFLINQAGLCDWYRPLLQYLKR